MRATVTMLDMNMGSFTLAVPQADPGTYTAPAPPVGMGGRWGWLIEVRPRGARTFRVELVDRIRP